jgi:hypothetical protein
MKTKETEVQTEAVKLKVELSSTRMGSSISSY